MQGNHGIDAEHKKSMENKRPTLLACSQQNTALGAASWKCGSH